MTLLLPDIGTLLPSASPWETAGGHDELATVIFLRGAILGSFGFVETQLNEIAIRSSRIPKYLELCQKFPWKLPDRLKYLSRAFSIEGPLQDVAPEGNKLVEEFREAQKLRNKWAHGALSVLPGTRDNRWLGAWITLKNFDAGQGQFNFSVDRWTGADIEGQARNAKSLADRSNMIHCSLVGHLPEL